MHTTTHEERRPRLRRWNAALVLLLLPSCALIAGRSTPPSQERPGILAITHVTVIPMTSRGAEPLILDDQTVLVRAGRIHDIGPSSEVRLPPGVLVVAGRGKFLLPGLADMHQHTWRAEELTLFVANGVTTVRNMGAKAPHLEMRARVARGELFGPTIHTAGPVIEGDPPVWPDSAVARTAAEARAIVERQHAAGYDFLKIYTGLSLPAFDRVMEAARALDMPVVGHVPTAVGLEHAIASGLRSVEHFTGYPEVLLPPANSALDWTRDWGGIQAEELTRIVEATRVAGVWNCPTLTMMMSPVLPAELEEAVARPNVRFVSPGTLSTWRKDLPYWSPMVWHWRRGMREACFELVRALDAASAGLLIGTDTQNSFVVPGFSVHQELQAFVDAGLSPFAALRAATSAPARFLDAADEFGTIAVGLRADLILLDANPLEDIANTQSVSGVILRGEWYSGEELQARIESLATRYLDPEYPADDTSPYGY